MAEPRYRMSDKGVLQIWNEKTRLFNPVDCFNYQHFCGTDCEYFKVCTPNDNNVSLTCADPNWVLTIEE